MPHGRQTWQDQGRQKLLRRKRTMSRPGRVRVTVGTLVCVRKVAHPSTDCNMCGPYGQSTDKRETSRLREVWRISLPR